jgi:hypothetical protein
VYLRKLAGGATTRLSAPAPGRAARGPSRTVAVDADASRAAFVSEAALAGPANPDGDVYLNDTAAGRVSRVSRSRW